MPSVLAQNDRFWAILKPAGWLCVRGRHPGAPVLIDWVRRELGEAWVCHRLDLDTSGVWLVARSAEAHREAGAWFEGHRIKKEYVFLAEGTPKLPVMRLDAPIEGQKCLTQIQLTRKIAGGFYGVARPQSGRRHQIRIHLSGAGHPIWGDVRYGSSRKDISRTALHARVLELPGGERFEAPLPPDIAQWLEASRLEASGA